MPILFHEKEVIDDLFFTCVALQNIIAKWEGKDQWAERGVSWDKADGLFEDDDIDQRNWARPKVFRDGAWVKVNAGDDYSNIGRVVLAEDQQVVWADQGGAIPTGPEDLQRLVDLHTESDKKFLDLQKKLVQNFRVRSAEGTVHWLR
jgi:hypothetical protein